MFSALITGCYLSKNPLQPPKNMHLSTATTKNNVSHQPLTIAYWNGLFHPLKLSKFSTAIMYHADHLPKTRYALKRPQRRWLSMGNRWKPAVTWISWCMLFIFSQFPCSMFRLLDRWCCSSQPSLLSLQLELVQSFQGMTRDSITSTVSSGLVVICKTTCISKMYWRYHGIVLCHLRPLHQIHLTRLRSGGGASSPKLLTAANLEVWTGITQRWCYSSPNTCQTQLNTWLADSKETTYHAY